MFKILPPSFMKPQVFRYRLAYTFENRDHRQFYYVQFLPVSFKLCKIARGCEIKS